MYSRSLPEPGEGLAFVVVFLVNSLRLGVGDVPGVRGKAQCVPDIERAAEDPTA